MYSHAIFDPCIFNQEINFPLAWYFPCSSLEKPSALLGWEGLAQQLPRELKVLIVQYPTIPELKSRSQNTSTIQVLLSLHRTVIY